MAKVQISKGKFEGIQACADEHGVIAAAAMDQRGSLKKAIAKARGGEVSDEALTEFKTAVTKVLTKHATAILMESALSFMGLGDPNVVSWGSMIGTGRELVRTAWYLTALPGLAIVFTVLALNLIGDGLNDALNPRFSQDR